MKQDATNASKNSDRLHDKITKEFNQQLWNTITNQNNIMREYNSNEIQSMEWRKIPIQDPLKLTNSESHKPM
jgi:hypothetical protein